MKRISVKLGILSDLRRKAVFTISKIEEHMSMKTRGEWKVTAEEVYLYADRRGWKKKDGKPYESVMGLINAVNGLACRGSKKISRMRKKNNKKNKKKPVQIVHQNEEPPIKPIVVSKSFYSSWEWKRIRYDILEAFGATCMCCGAKKDDGVRICVDHIKPVALYPHLARDRSNLQVLCNDCNMGKGRHSQKDFRSEWQKDYFK